MGLFKKKDKSAKYQNAIEAVAEFWAENTFNNPVNQNNGDMDGMLFALANMASMQAQREVTSEQVELFKKNLVERMKTEYNKTGKLWSLRLDCDYGPCNTLAEAATDAGITNGMSFPWKTESWINEDGKAEASLGYHGPVKKLN